MKAYGNGTPQQCVLNLLSIIRGECPYDRCKGLADDISDKPLTGVFGEIITEAMWNIKNYEPRAKSEDINLIIQDYLSGKYTLGTSILTNEG